ncbi:MAG: nitroreductase/quinone reductase family protein [Myxococcota bacterium]
MRKLGVGLGAALLVLFALYLFVVATSPSEDVVVLVTRGPDGAAHKTSLWIVEDEGRLWLRSGNPTSAWLARLRSNPDVELARAGERTAYRAVPVETTQARDRVNALMAEKYGTSGGLAAWFGDRSRSVPIRLDPQ